MHAAEVANARIWCLSIRFQQGMDSFGDTLDLSTISSTANGELAPYNGLTYASGFSLDVSGLPIAGTLYLNLPAVADINGNGFNDFFESALSVGAMTSGSYTTGLENGTVTATWSRLAGSASGTCILHLVDSVYGDLGNFRHVFSVIEYSGPLTYTPGSNTVSGNLSLVETGDSTSQLAGPVQFTKISTNRFNRLILQSGAWTNSTAQTFTYSDELFLRDAPWTTNYYGFVQFDDGEPNTGEPDYLVWLLSIDDTNDANNNGIPDFSDDLTIAPPPKPSHLAINWTSTNLQISITGEVGHVNDIQQTFSLPATNWQTVASVTLTNSSQMIPITFPKASSAFWRVVTH